MWLGSIFKGKWLILLALLVLSYLLRNQLGLRISINLGVIEAVAETTSRNEGVYPHQATISANHRDFQKWLQYVSDGSNTDRATQWQLGRLALVTNRNSIAADLLYPLTRQGTDNPLLYHDALLASSRSGHFEDVIRIYETSDLSADSAILSDTISLAYLNRLPPNLELSASDSAQRADIVDSLQKAASLRPGDLFINYHLWKLLSKPAGSISGNRYYDTLAYVPTSALDPTDPRLFKYAARVIPLLLSDRLWDRRMALSVISYITSQHYSAVGTENLLFGLIRKEPKEADWHYYLGELYHRRGNLGDAIEHYLTAKDLEPGYASVYLRLGMVYQDKYSRTGKRSWLEQSAQSYERYHELSPYDVLGTKLITHVYQQLGRNEGPQLEDQLNAILDTKGTVAELLTLPQQAVDLGPNLLANGEFEEWTDGEPKSWRWTSNLEQGSISRALFIGRPESLAPFSGDDSAQIHGIWVRPDVKHVRAGYRSVEIPVSADSWYVLSFFYRTSRFAQETYTIWVSDQTDAIFSKDHSLPDTNGSWRKFVIIGKNLHDTQIETLLRIWSTGEVEFDNIELRQMTLYESVEPGPIVRSILK